MSKTPFPPLPPGPAAADISKVDSLMRRGRLGEAAQVLDEVERG